MYSEVLGVPINPMSEVLVTVGAYLALYYAIQGWINHGDEVIIIDPAYDCYSPQIKMAGGVPVSVPLRLVGFLMLDDASTTIIMNNCNK